jgi:hypothetical protein
MYRARLLEESSKRHEARSPECWLKGSHFASKEEKLKWMSGDHFNVNDVSMPGPCPSGQEDPIAAPHARTRLYMALTMSQGWGRLVRGAGAINAVGLAKAFYP